MISLYNYGDVKFILMGKSRYGKVLYTTGVYYLDGLLIDSGPANLKQEFAGVYKNFSVKELVNTHFHEDHVGNNLEVSKKYELIPKIHKAGIDKITHKQTKLDLYRRITWGIPEVSLAEPVGDKIKTPHFEFEVVHTPGHSPDHICLYEHERKWLFTGDLYLGSQMRLLEKDEKIYQMISSLKKISDLPVNTIFCSHRGKMENAKKLLSAKVSNIERLQEKILSLYKQGLSIEKITSKLFANDFFWRVFSNGHLTSRNLVSAFINQKDTEYN